MLLSPLRKYSPLDEWSPREIALFEAGICKLGKDFYRISKIIQTKKTSQVVEFYYCCFKPSVHYKLWKQNKNHCYVVEPSADVENANARKSIRTKPAEKGEDTEKTAAYDEEEEQDEEEDGTQLQASPKRENIDIADQLNSSDTTDAAPVSAPADFKAEVVDVDSNLGVDIEKDHGRSEVVEEDVEADADEEDGAGEEDDDDDETTMDLDIEEDAVEDEVAEGPPVPDDWVDEAVRIPPEFKGFISDDNDTDAGLEGIEGTESVGCVPEGQESADVVEETEEREAPSVEKPEDVSTTKDLATLATSVDQDTDQPASLLSP
jgi:hypothetical protein